jgi:hypothetical protein
VQVVLQVQQDQIEVVEEEEVEVFLMELFL